MSLNSFDYCMVIDLEATCCDRQTVPRREMEIIEIGAVMVEIPNFNVVSQFQTFVKPIRHPILTEFCKTLTSISQTQVNQAPIYPEAMAQFQSWFKVYSNLCWGSWGDYDRKQFEQDSQLHHLAFPLEFPHFNLKKILSKSQGLKGFYGMAKALKMAEIPLVGTHHRGIDDAYNIAQLMPYIFGDKMIW